MATNPMQRKSRNSFLLGMLLMLVIAAVIIFLLYQQIQKQKEEIQKYKVTTTNVYVLNEDVKSGQVLTTDMFIMKSVPTITIPAKATNDIFTTLSSYSLSDTDGRSIYYHKATSAEDTSYYFFMINGKEYKIYITDANGQEQVATNLTVEDKAYYYAGDNNTQKTTITVAENAVIAKVDLNANTVITTTLVERSSERTTDDLREQEYNIISLPVDLEPGNYVDIRLTLPNGQDYIVVSKKKVSIPVANGAYLTDTIKMNLNESEILTLSCAIVENYKVEGSKLYATKYTQAGIQDAAYQTYVPSTEVLTLVNNDRNVLTSAIKGIKERNNDIDRIINEYGNEDNISTKVEESITSTQDARKDYLQALVPVE